jgi:hypothetical protein
VNSSQIIILIVVIVVVAALALAALRMFGPQHNLRGRFGDEYDRVIAEKGNRADGESELRRRLKEHQSYQLRDVTDADRARYQESWMAVQKEFVDDPAAAVRDAEELVSVFATDRGYPATNYDDRIAQLSVEHAHALGHYRSAHDISVSSASGNATTEEMRQALVHYRDLFTDLVGADLSETSASTPAAVSATADTTAPAAADRTVAPVASNTTVAPNEAVSSDAPVEEPGRTRDAEAFDASAADESPREATVPTADRRED